MADLLSQALAAGQDIWGQLKPKQKPTPTGPMANYGPSLQDLADVLVRGKYNGKPLDEMPWHERALTTAEMLPAVAAHGVGAMAKGLWNGAGALFGDAVESAAGIPGAGQKVMDPETGSIRPEANAELANLAATLAMGGMATTKFGGPRLGIFGGKLAKTADLEALGHAEKMTAAGAFPDDIAAATGWSRAADGKWRFEIPDQNHYVDHSVLNRTGRLERASQYLREKYNLPSQKDISSVGITPEMQAEALHWADATMDSKGTVPLGDYLEHPELFKAYPSLRDLPLGRELDPMLRGSFDPKTNIVRTDGGDMLSRAGMKDSTVLHELQHKVQGLEGFAKGGNPAEFSMVSPSDDLINDAQVLRSIVERGSTWGNARQEFLNKVGRDAAPHAEDLAAANSYEDLSAMSASGKYRRLAGEVEARNVQKRMNFDPGKRADVPPIYTEDVPRARQIVRFGNSGPQASIPTDKPLVPSLAETLAGEAPKGIKAYHGSNEIFDQFDIGKSKTARDIYLSPSADDAGHYGKNLYEADIAGRVGDFTPDSRGPKQYKDLAKAYEDGGLSDYFESLDDFIGALDDGAMYQRFGGQSAQNAVTRSLFDLGYDALKIPDAGFGGRMSESIVIRDPAKARIISRQPKKP